MRILFIGSVIFSKRCLLKLIDIGHKPIGVCTLESSEFNSDHYDLSKISSENSIPFIYSKDINSEDSIKWISSLSPDLILCFGWSRLLKSEILQIPTHGVVGFHPSKLPENRGRHPLIWALVLGLKETASTFFMMDEGADTGDIISQKRILIDDNDNAFSLYEKVSNTALNQIEVLINQFISGSIEKVNQKNLISNSWRKRGINDGKIDWRMSAKSIYNLVRGLSKPYVGAHFEFKGDIIKVWNSKIIIDKRKNIEPGKVLSLKNGILIKTGDNSILLKNIEPSINLTEGIYL